MMTVLAPNLSRWDRRSLFSSVKFYLAWQDRPQTAMACPAKLHADHRAGGLADDGVGVGAQAAEIAGGAAAADDDRTRAQFITVGQTIAFFVCQILPGPSQQATNGDGLFCQ